VTADNRTDSAIQNKVVIIGSSIAKGVGASSYNYSWAGLMAANNIRDTFLNYSIPGYLTFHFLPANFTNLPIQPDANVNITAVIKAKPSIVIISITTNDIANGYTEDCYMENMKTITDTLEKYKTKYIVTSTTIRADLNPSLNASLLTLANRLKERYQINYVNIVSLIADTTTLTPRLQFYSADKIHPNNPGHKLIFEQVNSTYQKIK
jgi:lysophospholipase L1-like esterase